MYRIYAEESGIIKGETKRLLISEGNERKYCIENNRFVYLLHILFELLINDAYDYRDKVKEIFDSIIVENAPKFVIFIDGLECCRPNSAIEVLERIKHYFNGNRIIFVVSINREQLIDSILKYYGVNFDSTGYYCLENVALGLNDYYKLSFRENMRNYACISFALSSNYVHDNGYRGFMFLHLLLRLL